MANFSQSDCMVQAFQNKAGVKFNLVSGVHCDANVKPIAIEELPSKDVSSKHVLVSPLLSRIESVLKHYRHCKAKAPFNTLLCIAIPKWHSKGDL